MKRIYSIDFTRGLVMIIMALDHVRDLMHINSLTQSPTDLNTTSPALFFTRWITYFCAPVFVFLSGTSAFLSYRSKKDFSASRKFLLTRGLWFIFLDLTVINFSLWADIHFAVFIFSVVATIGFGLIILGLLLKSSPKTIGIIGLTIMFGHNLVPLIPLAQDSTLRMILAPLFGPGAFPLNPGTTFVMGYPPIPWLGVLLVGFYAGQLFNLPIEKRSPIFLKIGLASLAAFLLLRWINIYGDPISWSTQKNGLYTLLSFINFTKYPPSLQFCLATLGVMFLWLSGFERVNNKFTSVLNVFGKVPLFYFIVHFYLIHILMFIMVLLQGFKFSDLVFGFNFGRPKTPSGLSLTGIYLVWIGVVVFMYPLCQWYGKYKESHREKKWLRYL